MVAVVAIRQLRPGELTPTSPPRRYVAGHGYVRLRWKVDVREYVETYEHRVDGGRVTEAAHVHHRDHDRADNQRENLGPRTQEEHGRQHRLINRAEAARRYEGGETMAAIARSLGCHPAALSRALATEGVQRRSKSDYFRQPTDAEIRAAHRASTNTAGVAALLGVGRSRAQRMLAERGLAYAVGRHPSQR